MPPKKPAKDNGLCQLQRQVRTRKMCREELITVNENSDFVQFICNLNGDS